MPQVRLKIADAEGELPPVCMCCGDTATLTKAKKMSWCPPWVGVLILGGLLPYIIVVLILTKKARLQAPLCADHKHHWLWRTLVISFSLVAISLVSILLFIAASVVGGRQRGDNPLIGWVCLGVAVLFVLWLILVGVVNYSVIKPKEITEREILLDGVAPEFVEAYEEFAAQRPRRRRRPTDDDEEDEDRPPARKARSGETGIEESRRRRPRDDDE